MSSFGHPAIYGSITVGFFLVLCILAKNRWAVLSTKVHDSEGARVSPIVQAKKRSGAATITPSAAAGATPSAATCATPSAAPGATPSAATCATPSAAPGATPSAATGATPSAATGATDSESRSRIELERELSQLSQRLTEVQNAWTQALKEEREERRRELMGEREEWRRELMGEREEWRSELTEEREERRRELTERHDALLQQQNALQKDVRDLESTVVHLHRRAILDDARTKMHAKNPFTRKYQPGHNLDELLQWVKKRDLDARNLTVSALGMILDNNHFIRSLGNSAAHNASDKEKKLAVKSEVAQWARDDLGFLSHYAYDGPSLNGTQPTSAIPA